MSPAKHILTEVEKSLDEHFQTLNRPGLRSVRIVVKLGGNGAAGWVSLTPEFEREIEQNIETLSKDR